MYSTIFLLDVLLPFLAEDRVYPANSFLTVQQAGRAPGSPELIHMAYGLELGLLWYRSCSFQTMMDPNGIWSGPRRLQNVC